MKNKKVILICGFARGGTNILWNILQSHPQICSASKEIGEIFKESRLLRLTFNSTASPFIPCKYWLLDRHLFQLKMQTLQHPDNRYKNETQLYSAQEVAASALCLKGVNNDIDLADILLQAYPDMYIIFLTRNGYALCDGYLRRNFTISIPANLYLQMAQKVKLLNTKAKHFKLIKFEDILNAPFETAEQLFGFIEMPFTPTALRLKSKKTVGKDGEHHARYGQENTKYWFSKNTIHQLLVPEIDRQQTERLPLPLKQEFASIASEALQFFGY